MKKFLYYLTVGLGLWLAPAKAQVNVNINIGSQPYWGPVGYDHVTYYYLPDIETYYYVPRRQFVYLSNGNWVFSASLPSRYSGYDLYGGYKVVINSPRPYLHHHTYRTRYIGYRGKRYHQRPIRGGHHDSYYVRRYEGHGNRSHDGSYYRGDGKHGRGHGDQEGHGRGHDKGHGHGGGHGRGKH